MNINDYITRQESIINSCSSIASYNLNIDRKGSNSLFRYDNAPDPRAKNIKTFPCHKHLEDGNIIESKQMELSDIINEIENLFIAEDKD